jgi:hypothetical protein
MFILLFFFWKGGRAKNLGAANAIQSTAIQWGLFRLKPVLIAGESHDGENREAIKYCPIDRE